MERALDWSPVPVLPSTSCVRHLTSLVSASLSVKWRGVTLDQWAPDQANQQDHLGSFENVQISRIYLELQIRISKGRPRNPQFFKTLPNVSGDQPGLATTMLENWPHLGSLSHTSFLTFLEELSNPPLVSTITFLLLAEGFHNMLLCTCGLRHTPPHLLCPQVLPRSPRVSDCLGSCPHSSLIPTTDATSQDERSPSYPTLTTYSSTPSGSGASPSPRQN